MRILLSNDDGVFSEGMRALALALQDGNELYIAAPDKQQSAASRSMTLYAPLRARKVELPGIRAEAYAVSGTPVDCVRLAVGNLVPEPDIVVSGINHGPNQGTDVLYSGTVAAAHEGALLGYPAIAVSDCAYHPQYLETAARVARLCVGYMTAHPLAFGRLMNVNVPDIPFAELKGWKKAGTCVEEYALQYIERKDPMGVPYYWAPRERLTNVCGQDVDTRWTGEGYAVLTPLTYDLTDRAALTALDLTDLEKA